MPSLIALPIMTDYLFCLVPESFLDQSVHLVYMINAPLQTWLWTSSAAHQPVGLLEILCSSAFLPVKCKWAGLLQGLDDACNIKHSTCVCTIRVLFGCLPLIFLMLFESTCKRSLSLPQGDKTKRITWCFGWIIVWVSSKVACTEGLVSKVLC